MTTPYGDLEVALDCCADLGEGPWWDRQTHSLLWLDLFEGRIHSFDPSSGADTSIDLGQPVGGFALRTDGGILAAVRDGVGFADRGVDGLELVLPIEREVVANRANDGACDAAGRFWYGTMAYDQTPGAGTVYRIDPDLTVTPVIAGTTTSNGIDWSPDNRTMYHADTGTGTVTAYEYDLATGRPSNPAGIFSAPAGAGSPDGLCVDAHGDLWVAMWGGSAVLRLSPDGELTQRIPVPAALVTSVAFGGSALDELYITTARTGRTAEELVSEPHAGSIFHLRPGAEGIAPHAFAG